MNPVATFGCGTVEALLERARRVCPLPDPGEGDEPSRRGWRKSTTDPARLLAAFPSLRLKPGLALRAYIYRESIGGNGVIWAMPESEPFPEPNGCPRERDGFLDPPRPPGAAEVADAIEGDGSPGSYLEASLFLREAKEFGAWWHGLDWHTHEILFSDPWAQPSRGGEPFADRGHWDWLAPEPTEWRPTVWSTGDMVRVTLHTRSACGQQAICAYEDTYRVGSYRPDTNRSVVASGPMGYIF